MIALDGHPKPVCDYDYDELKSSISIVVDPVNQRTYVTE